MQSFMATTIPGNGTAQAVPPASDLDLAVGAVASVLALVVAVVVARRRGRSTDDRPPRRLLRVLYPSLLMALALAAPFTAVELESPSVPAPTAPVAAFAFVMMALVYLVLFGLTDFWLGLFRPRRTPGWLAAGIVAFILVNALVAALAIWLGGPGTAPVQWADLAIAAMAAAAGILWWAYLPSPHPDRASVFE